MKLTTHLCLVPRLWLSGAIPPLPLTYSWRGAWLSTGTTLTFFLHEVASKSSAFLKILHQIESACQNSESKSNCYNADNPLLFLKVIQWGSHFVPTVRLYSLSLGGGGAFLGWRSSPHYTEGNMTNCVGLGEYHDDGSIFRNGPFMSSSPNDVLIVMPHN